MAVQTRRRLMKETDMENKPPTIEELKPLLRPLFAAMAMAGHVSSTKEMFGGFVDINALAKCSVRCADALLVALQEAQP